MDTKDIYDAAELILRGERQSDEVVQAVVKELFRVVGVSSVDNQSIKAYHKYFQTIQDALDNAHKIM